MLGKLIKWEFMSRMSMYIKMFLFTLICSSVTFIVTSVRERIGGGMLIGTIETMCVVTTLLAVLAVFGVIFIMSITRYYENLVKDEGYLMHTLPVSAFQLHITKLIVPLVWLAAGALIALLSVSVITANTLDIQDIIELLFASEYAAEAWSFVGYCILSVISSLSIFYACINIGSLSNTNKGAMAFVAYIVIYLINQVLNAVAMLVSMFILFAGEEDIWAAMNAPVPPDGFVEVVFATAGIISVICIVAYNLISLHILKNKVNLE